MMVFSVGWRHGSCKATIWCFHGFKAWRKCCCTLFLLLLTLYCTIVTICESFIVPSRFQCHLLELPVSQSWRTLFLCLSKVGEESLHIWSHEWSFPWSARTSKTDNIFICSYYCRGLQIHLFFSCFRLFAICRLGLSLISLRQQIFLDLGSYFE